MARIDNAIKACEKFEDAATVAQYPTWAAFVAARDAAEAEYKTAMSEMSIRLTRQHLTAQRAA